MKRGLSYISERTGEFRAADNAENVKWFHPLSEYTPIETIRRGEAVSIATPADIEEIAKNAFGDTDKSKILKELLLNSSESYIVKTRPSRHTSAIGLAEEYVEVSYTKKSIESNTDSSDSDDTDSSDLTEVSNEEIELNSKLCHIVGNGKYVEDFDYVFESEMTQNVEDYNQRLSTIEKTEYVPDFFKDYKNNIGLKVYVDAEAAGNGQPGLLTTDREKAYLSYNNVIVIGFISDAYQESNDVHTERYDKVHVGAIEVQIEGDDRGVVDSTQTEAVLGEDVEFALDSTNPVKIFALGNEGDTPFSFEFGVYSEKYSKADKLGFIALQKVDGKTAFIVRNDFKLDYINSDENNNANNNYSANDNAFIQIAKFYKKNKIEEKDIIKVTDFSKQSIQDALNEAMKKIARTFENNEISFDPNKSSYKYENFDHFYFNDLKTNDTNYLLTATARTGDNGTNKDYYDGSYEIYISRKWSDIFVDLSYTSHGSLYNKGYAVLADLRFENRMNVLGAYVSTKESIKRGESATFMRQGLFTARNDKAFKPGQNYWLGTHGNLVEAPIDFYDNVLKVGTAQTGNKLIISLEDARRSYDGYLPVGFIKPSVNGKAEYGFVLMDGKTHLKLSEANELHQFLQQQFELKYDDGGNEFIVPEMYYSHTKTNDDSDSTDSEDKDIYNKVYAQIKYLSNGLYYNVPRHPFLNKEVVIHDNKISGIDITDLIMSGPYANEQQVPTLENLEIKLFVDISDENSDNKIWTEIQPGFHIYNNFEYYGFRWEVTHKDPTVGQPIGQFNLECKISGNPSNDNSEDSYLGIRFLKDPYSPPVSLNGKTCKVLITFRQYYARQYDVSSIFDSYIKENIFSTDEGNSPWTGKAVSGKAVYDFIDKSVNTNALIVGNEKNPGSVTEILNNLSVKLKGNAEKHVISGDLLLKNYDETLAIEFNDGILYYKKQPSQNYNKTTWNTDSHTLYNGNYKNPDDSLLNSIATVKTISDHAISRIENYNDILSFSTENIIDKINKAPHGIYNAGKDGNINAFKLWDLKPGRPYHSYTGNIYGSDVKKQKLETEDVILPIMYRIDTTDNKSNYTFEVGNTIKYYFYDSINGTTKDGTFRTLTKTFDVSSDENFFTEEIKFNKNDKAQSIKISFNEKEIDFDPKVTIKAIVDPPSSKEYKDIYREYSSNYKIPADDFYKYNEEENVAENNKLYNIEALQALREVPLAEWHYKNQVNDKNRDQVKKYFGLITEHVAETIKTFNENEAEGKTTFDNVKYKFTETENKNISDFLGKLTDNNDKSVNVVSSIGILMKAAQETQERLLNLEVSSYGKDSPTLPGDDVLKITKSYTAIIDGIAEDFYIANEEVFKNSYWKSIVDKDTEDGITFVDSAEFNTYILEKKADKTILSVPSDLWKYVKDDNEKFKFYGYIFSENTGSDKNTHPFTIEKPKGENDSANSEIHSVKVNTELSQNATTLGLNRLIKALCREIYQSSDPSFDDFSKAMISKNSISRIDKLDRGVFGQNAVNFEDSSKTKSIELKPEYAKYYPESIKEESEVSHHDDDYSLDVDENYTGIEFKKYSFEGNNPYESGNWDGLNDAVNKIALKLNTLTKYIVGEDNINNGPLQLNVIKANIRTLINELYNNKGYTLKIISNSIGADISTDSDTDSGTDSDTDNVIAITSLDDATFIKRAKSDYGTYKFIYNRSVTGEDGSVDEPSSWTLMYYEDQSSEPKSDKVTLSEFGITVPADEHVNGANFIIEYKQEKYDDVTENYDHSYYKNPISGSRLDRIINSLYNFNFEVIGSDGGFAAIKGPIGGSLSTDSTDSTDSEDEKISELTLKVNGKSSDLIAKDDIYTAYSPEEVTEFKDKATIIDVIIDLLVGDNKHGNVNTSLLRKNKSDNDLLYTYKSKENIIHTAKELEDLLTSNTTVFASKNILTRIAELEKIIQLMILRFQNNWNIEEFKDAVTEAYQSNLITRYSYNGVKSVDAFLDNISSILGVKFDGTNNNIADYEVDTSDGKNTVYVKGKKGKTDKIIAAEKIAATKTVTPTVTKEKHSFINDDKKETSEIIYHFEDKGKYTLTFDTATNKDDVRFYQVKTNEENKSFKGDQDTYDLASVKNEENKGVLTINEPISLIIDPAPKEVEGNKEESIFVAPENTYGIIYDTVSRLRQEEYKTAALRDYIGSEYGEIATLTDTCNLNGLSYDSTSNNHTHKYTLTRDMKRLGCLLFPTKAKCDSNPIHYNNDTNDNPWAGSVLDNLYTSLYNMPTAYTAVNTTTTTCFGGAKLNTCGLYYFDPKEPRSKDYNFCTDEWDNLPSPLTYDYSNSTDCFTNLSHNGCIGYSRLDAAEDAIKALYTFIGMGETSCINYFTGEFDKVNKTVNGMCYTPEGTCNNLTSYAMQAYDTAEDNKTYIDNIIKWLKCATVEDKSETDFNWNSQVSCAYHADVATKTDNSLTILYDSNSSESSKTYNACINGNIRSYYTIDNNCTYIDIYESYNENKYHRPNRYNLTSLADNTEYCKLIGSTAFQYNGCLLKGCKLYSNVGTSITSDICPAKESINFVCFDGSEKIDIDLSDFMTTNEVTKTIESSMNTGCVKDAGTAEKVKCPLTINNSYLPIKDKDSDETIGYNICVTDTCSNTPGSPITFNGSEAKSLNFYVPLATANTAGLICGDDCGKLTCISADTKKLDVCKGNNVYTCVSLTTGDCNSISLKDDSILNAFNNVICGLRDEFTFEAGNQKNIGRVLTYLGGSKDPVLYTYKDESDTNVTGYALNIDDTYYSVTTTSCTNYCDSDVLQIKANPDTCYGKTEVYFNSQCNNSAFSIYVKKEDGSKPDKLESITDRKIGITTVSIEGTDITA